MPAPSKSKSKTTDPTQAFLHTVEENVERGRTLVQTNLESWFSESGRFLEQMALDAEETLEQLQHCKSPLDAAVVQQGWAAARAKAWFDAGMRALQGAGGAAKAASGPDSKSDQSPAA